MTKKAINKTARDILTNGDLDRMSYLIESYPKILQLTTDIGKNLLSFIQFMSDEGFFYMLGDDDATHSRIGDFLDNHTKIMTEISHITSGLLGDKAD